MQGVRDARLARAVDVDGDLSLTCFDMSKVTLVGECLRVRDAALSMLWFGRLEALN